MDRRKYHLKAPESRIARCGRVLIKGKGIGRLVLNLGNRELRCKACWKAVSKQSGGVRDKDE